MRVVNTAVDPSAFSVGSFGTTMTFASRNDIEPEDLLTMFMKSIVFEARVKESAYPLIEEDVLQFMMEY